MAAVEEQDVESGSLQITPTWAVALVCSIFVLASLGIERALHYTGKWLRRHNQKPLDQALNKVKEELMLLGFISLLLAVFQPTMARICVPHSVIEHMLPCKVNTSSERQVHGGERRLLAEAEKSVRDTERCLSKHKVPLISREALHQLHIFIFVLAIVHVVYSCLTLLLGRFKIHGWRKWEREAQSNAIPKVRRAKLLGRQSSFIKKHANPKYMSSSFLIWTVCFFRQFGRTPTRVDYETLRRGFIRNHNIRSTFDFHRYINRVLEDDFRKVVGISFYLWVFVVVFLLLNVNGWHTYFWIAFIPLGLTLLVGAKLQNIIVSLAVDIAEEQKTEGNVVVKPRDELFWFNRPKVILYLLHFVLFQNAFELAFFFWIWATFGFNSCFSDNRAFIIVRLVIGVVVQVLCSYSTLPLYALVTQMGSQYKAAIFNEQVHSAITSWHAKVKDKIRQKRNDDGSTTPSDGSSQHPTAQSSRVEPASAVNGFQTANRDDDEEISSMEMAMLKAKDTTHNDK